MADQLTAKQDLFAFHYVDCLNATEAARRAGYSGNDNGLGVVGHQNLRKSKIKAKISELMQERLMPADEILRRFSLMASGELPTRVSEGPKGTFTDYDTKAANDILAKHYGLLIERVEHRGTIEHRHITDSEVVREFAALVAEGEAGSTSGTGS